MSYNLRLIWAIAWRYAATAAAVCALLWVTGCAATRLDHEATAVDRAACQQATGSYKGAMWLAAYRDCLLAKGYQ